tara:strand:- start:1630 stop:1788 length:159 start_codon:yes stop_codon:yes gene_type:complete
MSGKKDFLKSTWKPPKIVNLTGEEKIFIKKNPFSPNVKRIQINEMRKYNKNK